MGVTWQILKDCIENVSLKTDDIAEGTIHKGRQNSTTVSKQKIVLVYSSW